MTQHAPITWLDGAPPAALSGGTTWGMPFARGTVTQVSELSVVDARGCHVDAQTWPLATWPDGSLKWAGIALGATGNPASAYSVTSSDKQAHDGGPGSRRRTIA
ncbi:hypothetical protein [Arthrobacter sp. StoSoilB13]|uniref:RIFT barrel domain-containing protein n=1 Tax=Arthrobacter sp. StoSoilB13 TaxID=2830993 RepID=UPI001E6FF8D3|nr:hypothetical protein [Arthrobacter sp. StoSoilB13]BCW49915.1 hypothetical protein StoSoilB13_22570 [Arthrobacter sp. StoSoilB13]